jgi:type I restriction enzyme S subunit
MSFPRYESYKDSGVEWLGEVPEHWEITKTKHVTKFHTGWTPPTGKNESYEGENLWANISDLGEKLLFDTAKRISDEAIASSRITPSPKGSLLFSFKLSIGQVSFAG